MGIADFFSELYESATSSWTQEVAAEAPQEDTEDSEQATGDAEDESSAEKEEGGDDAEEAAEDEGEAEAEDEEEEEEEEEEVEDIKPKLEEGESLSLHVPFSPGSESGRYDLLQAASPV
jgi:ubiquinol-cytochrome c reductase subunit 6